MVIFNKTSIRLALVGYEMTDSQHGAARKKSLSLCLLVVLGSQGIVVKCTAAIIFRTADYRFQILWLIFAENSSSFITFFFSIIGDLQVCNLLFTRKKTIVVIWQLRI